jgi:rhamnosyltransferase
MPETSIIIRTKNEERWIGETLKELFNQTYQDFEVIVIDSGSKDKTLAIVKSFPKVKLLEIPSKDFSYPYALNFAIKRSKAIKYICVISGHSVPMTNTYLQDAISDFDLDPKVMGVYGLWKALPDSTFWDKFIINPFFGLIFVLKGNPIIYSKKRGGILQFSNAIFKKEFWDKKNFDERYGLGGEDYEWAVYWLNKGYKIVLEKKMTLFHSHYLNLWEWVEQFMHWMEVLKPHKFDTQKLKFRKNLNYK